MGDWVVLVAAGLAVVAAAATLPMINAYLVALREDDINAAPVGFVPLAMVMVVAFVAMAAALGDHWVLVSVLLATTTMVAVSATDVRSYRIADRILFPGLGVTVLAASFVALGPGEPSQVGRALAFGAIFWGLLLVIALVSGGGMGLGDVKLALLLGFVLGLVAINFVNGLRLLLITMLIASVLGVVNGLLLASARRVTGRNLLPDPDEELGAPRPSVLKTPFPFGPGLVIGTMVAVALRDSLL